jgi:hypothetical protein
MCRDHDLVQDTLGRPPAWPGTAEVVASEDCFQHVEAAGEVDVGTVEAVETAENYTP